PGPPVHGVARLDGIRRNASARGNRAREESSTASADARQGGALLEDAVGRVSLADGVCRLRRSAAAAVALHRRVQLPTAAPGAERAGAGGSILPRGAAGASSGREERGRERGTAGAREAGDRSDRGGEDLAAAVLPTGDQGAARDAECPCAGSRPDGAAGGDAGEGAAPRAEGAAARAGEAARGAAALRDQAGGEAGAD